MEQFTDMETWLHDNADERVFRVWRYKKVFTPYETGLKAFDESVFEDDIASYRWLSEVVELGNGRIMFGFKDAVSCLMYENGERKSEPPIEYMFDGDFKMEYVPGDLERLIDEMGYSGGEEEETVEEAAE